MKFTFPSTFDSAALHVTSFSFFLSSFAKKDTPFVRRDSREIHLLVPERDEARHMLMMSIIHRHGLVTGTPSSLDRNRRRAKGKCHSLANNIDHL